ncbi:helix-turn-helix domain-containing protein [Streptomyces viridochromogenes]|uniref:helix-turn-helix domain-containing protein n=1 Tax=Streptomyces viridochromogenes TaxID=1938 RepID=UPI0002FDB1FB|nr:helix-turn-helix transcriptional regulator [Streptomyces viridochromogenes]
MSDAEAFGPWLERQLRRRGVTQAELAASLKVTRAAVSAWSTGRAMPRMEKLRGIEKYLGLEYGSTRKVTEDTHAPTELTWYHRREHADGGREMGNAAAFAFDAELRVLAREAIQNSLDERRGDTRPVRVRFVLHEIRGERLIRFLDLIQWDKLRPHYEAAAKLDQKAGRVLQEGMRALEEERLLLLRIDDYNANGLTGGDYEEGRFTAVVRDQLNSFKSDKHRAAGSYGLGKATLWAASRLGMVLMNSTLSEPHEGRRERRMIGRLDLPWRRVNGEGYAGPAWFGAPDERRESATRSWWADEATAEALYLERDSDDPGTSFLVVGAYDSSGQLDPDDLEGMHRELLKGIARDFWAAMVASRDDHPHLTASVAAFRDGEVVVAEERVDPHLHEPARSRAMQAFLEGRTVTELTTREDVAQATVMLDLPELKRGDKNSSSEGQTDRTHEAILLLTPTDEDDPGPNHLVGMRGGRMVVMKRKLDLPVGATPFQAVLLAGYATLRDSSDCRAAERFLRAAEPPDHNDWRSTEDLTATYRRGAVKLLTDFKNAMRNQALALARGSEPGRDTEEGPAVLVPLLRLDRPQQRRRLGYPTVDSVNGEVDQEGAWRVRVRVTLPERDEPWILSPEIFFSTQSGAKFPVDWAELVPERGCESAGDKLLRFQPGTRAVFTGVSDVSSHPVAAHLARVEVDVHRAKGAMA